MQRELYFDISSAESGGSLFRIVGGEGSPSFYYNHSTYDSDKDEMKVFETNYPDFASFWKELTKDPQWWYLHPLFVHPEQRDFIREQLKTVNWAVHSNKKWQDSHQRQWKKVLTGPGGYYPGPDSAKTNSVF
ncbi:MAG TPA: hypothetical protein VNS58_21190 [Puia sp.]|nr:hypothetical protein [Puia sp.]